MRKIYSKFLIALILIFTSAHSFSGVVSPSVSGQPSIKMGGVEISLGKAIVLQSYTALATEYKSLYRNGSAYQVPTGKKLIIVAARAQSPTTSGIHIGLGYGDTSVFSTSAPTNAVTFSVNGSAVSSFVMSSLSAGSSNESPAYAEIPAGKYPFMKTDNSGIVSVQFLAYLIDV